MIAIQLDLLEDVVALPWNGRSPRSLTRAAKASFLRREPQKDERFFVDPEQYDMFRRRKRKAPPLRGGAPLLKEPGWLKEGR